MEYINIEISFENLQMLRESIECHEVKSITEAVTLAKKLAKLAQKPEWAAPTIFPLVENTGKTVLPGQRYGHRIEGKTNHTGLIPVNAAVVTPTPKDTLSQKILSELEVLTMIALEPCNRNKVILKTFYYAGLRTSELRDLNWEDLNPNGESGQLLIGSPA